MKRHARQMISEKGPASETPFFPAADETGPEGAGEAPVRRPHEGHLLRPLRRRRGPDQDPTDSGEA